MFHNANTTQSTNNIENENRKTEHTNIDTKKIYKKSDNNNVNKYKIFIVIQRYIY